ncbi:MAG: hypothetical protein ACJ72E_17295 [Marmoricola sp.]
MHRIDSLELLLSSGLDLSKPFSTSTADEAGVARSHRTRLLAEGLLRTPIQGVMYAAHLDDTLDLRLECVRLAVPADAVVTDRTAGWLHGASMVLAPGDHLRTPRVAAFQPPGKRLRNGLTDSGERGLTSEDVVVLGGLRVTTALRTACDLGRLLRRDAAWAALDSMLRLGAFSQAALIAEVERFRGYRGVRQLRVFAPLADADSESFGESVLRLRWYDAGLAARPETQVVVRFEDGRHARLDVASRERRYAAEYDGEEFHGEAATEHDARRRARISDEGWVIDVFTRRNVFGRQQDAIRTLRTGFRRASLIAATAPGRRT